MPYMPTLGWFGGQCSHIWHTWSVWVMKLTNVEWNFSDSCGPILGVRTAQTLRSQPFAGPSKPYRIGSGPDPSRGSGPY